VPCSRVLLAALGIAVFPAAVASATFAVRAYQKTLELQDTLLQDRAAQSPAN
jgi:hypothetical protein